MFLGALFLLGTAICAYGQVDGAAAQAEAGRADAQAKRAQAKELLARQDINEQIMRDQSERLQKGYGAAFSGTGFGGGGLSGVMEIRKTTLENIALSRRDAEFKAKMLRMGADVESKLASDTMTAGYLSGFGTVLQSGFALQQSMFKAPSKPQSLPGG